MPDNMIVHQAPVSPVARGCAAKTGSADTATRDAAAIELGYRTYLSQGLSSPPIVPPSVGHNGAIDATNARQVNKMIECMGTSYGLDPRMTSELKGMYSDSVQLEQTAHRNGVHTHR
jgi:hypothetical protein